MFKVRRFAEGKLTVFAISGRLQDENLKQLEVLLGTNLQRAVLDLEEVSLAGREVIRFLARCEENGAQLRNCPGYICEWIAKERAGGNLDGPS